VRPNYLRLDQVGRGSTCVLYFDGRAGWEILPGIREVVALTGGELPFAQKYLQNFTLNIWLADRDLRFTGSGHIQTRSSSGSFSGVGAVST